MMPTRNTPCHFPDLLRSCYQGLPGLIADSLPDHYGTQVIQEYFESTGRSHQAQNKIKIEVIQGGLGMEVPDLPFEPIAHETTQTSGILHKDGVISMGRLEPGTATSEFFICINDQPELDFGGDRYPDGQGFATFGKVVKGMDIVRAIQAMKTDMPEGEELEYTSGQMLIEPVDIYKINRAEQPR